MRTLFVYDNYLIVERTSGSFEKNDIIYLFSLTSKNCIKTAIMDKAKCCGCALRLLESVQLMSISAERLRGRYMRFIADFPERVRCRGRGLKDIFAIDRNTSMWWFSLIAEKNTFKSDSFSRLVQLDAIIEVINREKIEKIMFGCQSNKLSYTLFEYAYKKNIKFERLSVKTKGNLKTRIKEFQKMFYLKHIAQLFYTALRIFFNTQKVKMKLKSLKRSSLSERALMIITPYPNFDIISAHNGIFKNRFYGNLQGELEIRGQKIIWVMMYVPKTPISHKKSLDYAVRFMKSGHMMFFLEEFNSIPLQIKSLVRILREGLKFLKVESDICSKHTFGEYNFYPVFKDDWYSSFTGNSGYLGILYYEMFKSLLRKFDVKKCLYSCEMQAWEKALIKARDAVGSGCSLYAYQSGTVSRMLLNFFNHPSEIATDGLYAIPKPEKIICNGKLNYSYMRESGWPEERLAIAEAIRYNHLKKYSKTKCNRKNNVVLLAFSISPEESSSILNVAYESLIGLKNIEVWVKPHPFLQIDKVFRLSGILPKNFSFQVKNDPIENLLSQAKIVVAGESGVSIEALALGCEIVIVNTPEWLNMSPLSHVNARMIRIVNSPEELKQAVLNIIKKEDNTELKVKEAEKIINEYFYLNRKSDIPETFLQLLRNINL